MASFNREIVELVTSTCRAGQDRAAQTLGTVFNSRLALSVGEGSAFQVDQIPAECTGPGVLFVLQIGGESALVVLPDSSGVLPTWCSEPSDEVKSRLAQLANELAPLFFPEPFSTTQSTGRHVPDLAVALRQAEFANESARVTIQVRDAERAGVLSVIWPAANGDAAVRDPSSETDPQSQSNTESQPTAETAAVPNRGDAATLEVSSEPSPPNPPTTLSQTTPEPTDVVVQGEPAVPESSSEASLPNPPTTVSQSAAETIDVAAQGADSIPESSNEPSPPTTSSQPIAEPTDFVAHQEAAVPGSSNEPSLSDPPTTSSQPTAETIDAAAHLKVNDDAAVWGSPIEPRSPSPSAKASEPTAEGTNPTAARPTNRPRPQINYEDLEDGIAQLPSYSRSLLKIKVPVMVTLAEAKQPLENVISIGPGSIIHFSKPCEDTLTLEVAGQKIAVGEAVKVGDKFGLWITSMILPEERFWVINKRAPTERAK